MTAGSILGDVDALYYYVPITAIVCVNSIWFLLITFKIYEIRRDLGTLAAVSESRIHKRYEEKYYLQTFQNSSRFNNVD